MRRVTIDVAGRLPTNQEIESFLADKSPNKRDVLVDRLVSSSGYADYFANKWATVLRNKRRNGNDIAYTYRFHRWIRGALSDNMPYDQFVRGVLTAAGDPETYPPVAWYREVNTSTAQMEDTAQLFLGCGWPVPSAITIRLSAGASRITTASRRFFTQVGLKNSKYNQQTNLPDMVYLKGNPAKSRNPRTGLDVLPAGLGAKPLEVAGHEDARHLLVDWMVAPDNPFFAKALVNRYWKHFFGKGIVDPEDDLRVTNPPSNPELLEALAKQFIDSKFDMQNLVRTICKSNVYQLSSEPSEGNQDDQQNFSRFYPRRLSAEVLYDAVNSVAQTPSNFGGIPAGTAAVQLPDNGFNNYFLQVFGKPEAESACECERSSEANLSQSLHLLNSNDVQGRLQNGNGRAARLARETERATADKIRELYLAAMSANRLLLRRVSPEAARQFGKSAAGLEDVLWAVFNAKEFQFVR